MTNSDHPHVEKYIHILKHKMSEKGWYAKTHESFDNVDSISIKFVKYGQDKELLVVISGRDVMKMHATNMDEMITRKLAGFI